MVGRSTCVGSIWSTAFSEDKSTRTSSTPGRARNARCTCNVHSTQSMPRTGPSSWVRAILALPLSIYVDRLVARTFVDTARHIPEQCIGQFKQSRHLWIAELVECVASLGSRDNQVTIR